MAMKLNAIFLVLLSVATLLHGSAAQTRHVVGNSTGWTIPSGGAAAYTSWAANQTFSVGDTLVFNFANGQHDVAKVTKSAFDACNGANALLTVTTGPATVTLNETGQQYFICTFGTHCSFGQKLAVNVVAKASSSPSPAPQPATPSPSPRASPVPAPAPAPTPTASAPAPAPSTGAVTYTVGDTSGWTVPRNGAAAYRTWASGKTFKVGDILVFNYQLNTHNVEEVTKKNFDSCNSSSPIETHSTPPTRVTLKSGGSHYFICGIPGHCSAGQRLAINVSGSATATPPSSSATPPSSSGSPSPSSGTNPSSPSPTGAAASPPQNSGAASLGAIGFSATLLSLVAALFY